MSKITKQELLTMVRNIENWMSDIKIEVFNQPNVTLPKSTRYDAEVGSRLDSLEARMDRVEGVFKTEPEPQHEPQKERKIVFDWLVHPDGSLNKPQVRLHDVDNLKEIAKLEYNKFLFLVSNNRFESSLIYIGHYE
jgi:hypothetical protein